MHCFRSADSHKWYDRCKEVYHKNHDNFIKEAEGDETKEAQIQTDLLYGLFSNMPKSHGKLKEKFLKEQPDLLLAGEYFLEDSVKDLDGDYLAKLATSLYLSGSYRCQTVLWQIDEKMREIKNELDTFQLSTIFRAFSKWNNGKSWGKDETFTEFEPIVLSKL